MGSDADCVEVQFLRQDHVEKVGADHKILPVPTDNFRLCCRPTTQKFGFSPSPCVLTAITDRRHDERHLMAFQATKLVTNEGFLQVPSSARTETDDFAWENDASGVLLTIYSDDEYFVRFFGRHVYFLVP